MTNIIENRGITLVALVITIIILLILSTVSVNILFGAEGLMTKTMQVRTIYDHAKVKEALAMLLFERQMELSDLCEYDYIEQRQIIDSEGKLDVEKLLGEKLSTGNGKLEEKDNVYQLNNNVLVYYENGEFSEIDTLWKNWLSYEYMDTNKVRLTGFNINNEPDAPTKLIIPKRIGRDVIAEIPHHLNQNGVMDSIEELVIQTEVVEIWDAAFQDMDNLKVLKITSPTIKTLRSSAFSRCSKLETIELVEGLEKIDQFCFDYSGLKSLKIPSTVISIGDAAFARSPNLKEVIIEGCKTLGNSSFQSCTSLEKVKLPQNLESIGNYCFEYTSIANIEVPSNVGFIDDGAFARCEKLVDVKLNEGLVTIGNYCFQQCSLLPTIIIPLTTISVGYYAFDNTSSLQTIKCRASVEQSPSGAPWGNITVTMFYNYSE